MQQNNSLANDGWRPKVVELQGGGKIDVSVRRAFAARPGCGESWLTCTAATPMENPYWSCEADTCSADLVLLAADYSQVAVGETVIVHGLQPHSLWRIPTAAVS